jgi:hypothetical protein
MCLSPTKCASLRFPEAGGNIILSVPGKIERRYDGTIRISHEGGELIAIVEMDREVAIASIVAAEIAPGAPLEALKAHVAIGRSILAVSYGRHRRFQFCDTTRCQFIRSLPSAYRAAVARGQLPGTDPNLNSCIAKQLPVSFQQLDGIVSLRYRTALGEPDVDPKSDGAFMVCVVEHGGYHARPVLR